MHAHAWTHIRGTLLFFLQEALLHLSLVYSRKSVRLCDMMRRRPGAHPSPRSSPVRQPGQVRCGLPFCVERKERKELVILRSLTLAAQLFV
jgi:hypothetical protein